MRIARAVGLLLAVAIGMQAFAEQTSDYAVQVSATVSKSPPSITLSWPAPTVTPGQYRIFRKAKTDGSFGSPIATLGGSSTSYTDNNVSVGNGYEYAVDTNGSYGFGYIYAGIEVPMIDARGKIILIVDNTQGPSMSNELNTLQQDWVGDGWTVIRHDVGRAETVTNIKALISADYNADPTNVKAVLLFGHVPVPYSGDLNPDGHPQHKGAWPADCYYGVMNGNWSDSSVNDTGASARDTSIGDNPAANQNRPGDGKFDQTTIPGPVVLQVGRVDLQGLPQFAPLAETDLLRNYLNKDHKFRSGQINIQRRGLVDDNFGTFNGEAFAANGWRNFAPMFGAQNITVINSSDQNANANNWTNTLQSNSYLWCCGVGAGYWYIAQGVSKVDMFAQNDPLGVFYMLFGSFFGDYDSMQNYLRAPLGSKTSGLAAMWTGRPNWYVHHMVLGDTIGYSAALVQNNTGLYRTNTAGNQIHIALMGDPTLRMHPVQPASNLNSSPSSGSVALTWSNSSDSNISGYHVYRSTSSSGPFTRLTGGTIAGNSYTDNGLAAGTYTYMVRAVKLESTGSGTYFNPSQGIFSTVTVGGGGNTSPTITTAAAANPNPANVGQTVTFTVGASDTDGDTLSYQWNYGDGTINANGSHSYSNAGNYTATVTVSDGHGNNATSSVGVSVNAASGNRPPVITSPASANPNPATVGQAVGFAVAASDPDNDPLTYQWNYGDGVSDFNAMHAYTASGTYTGTVTVNDGHGHTVTSSVTVTVSGGGGGGGNPVFTAPIKAWPSNPNIAQQVLFTLSTSDPNNYPVTISYNYGDGSAAGYTETHLYMTAGTYNAVATATDSHGGTATSSATVTVGGGGSGGGGNTPPTITATAAASPNPATVGQAVRFTVAASDGDGDTLTTSWNYGDNSSDATGVHAYATAGAYKATATVSDGHGNSITSSTNVTINAVSGGGGIPVFTAPLQAWPSNPNVGQQVLFTLSASDPDKESVVISYNYGDGTSGYIEKHTYTIAGTYTVVATADDGHGGTATSSTTVTVGGGNTSGGTPSIVINPPLQAWPNPVQINQPVLFTIGVTDKNSWTVKWTYGDGTSGATERHIYATGGSYIATATITDNKGASNSSSVVVNVSVSAASHSASGDPTSAAASSLQVSALAVKLDFARQGNDAITLSGTLPVSKGFKAAGSVMALDVAGVSKTFMLSPSGGGTNGKSSSRIHIKSSKGSLAAQQATFKILIKSGDFSALSTAGLTNANHKGDHASLPIMLVFDNTLYESTAPVTMQGDVGKALLAKK